MTDMHNARVSPPRVSERAPIPAHADKYHPHCGDAHQHKPTKAIIGVGFLMVLSFLLYEFNGKTTEHHSAAAKSPSHLASNSR